MNYKEKWEVAIAFDDYLNRVKSLAEQGLTTGEQSEALVKFSELNLHRMTRIQKQYIPSPEVVASFKSIHNFKILTITEGWCGDAAQVLPVIDNMAKLAGVAHRVILRDQHPDLMDQHLSNGKRSIPIVLFLVGDQFEVKGTFGSRPKALEKIVHAMHQQVNPVMEHAEVSKEIQLWYTRDKQASIESDVMEVLDRIEQEA